MKHFYPLMSWSEAKEAAQSGKVAILPIGTVDANGPLTPLGFDYLVAEELAKNAAERSDSVWLPPLAYGVSEALDNFPGTITMTPELLGAQVDAIVRSLIKTGFEHILLINNHGPNQFPVEYACRRIRRETGVLVASINPAQVSADLRGDIFGETNQAIGHGSEPGVSLLMHLYPGSVNLEKAEARPKQEFQGHEVITPTEIRFEGSRVNVYLELEEVSVTAGWSDPTEASRERGGELFERMADFTVRFIEEFKKMDTRAEAPRVQS